MEIEITGDLKDINRAIVSLDKRIDKFSDQTKKQLGGATGAFAKFGLAISGVREALRLLSNTFGPIIKLTSDAEEIASKFNVVFAETAERVREWADEFGNAQTGVGRARLELEQMLSTMQDTFIPMGIARDKAADLSMQMVELAVDVASFNNAQDMDVLKAFQSAIVGNHETVRRFGIVISEATIKQEALNSGITDNVKNMTDQEKIQARLNLIIKGSSDAQGDAMRTADSFANSIKRLRALFVDYAVRIGNQVLPKITELVNQAIQAAVSTEKFFASIDLVKLKSYGSGLAVVSVAMVSLKVASVAATIATKALRVALIATGWGAIAVAVGIVVGKLFELSGIFEQVVDNSENLKKEMEEELASLESTRRMMEGFGQDTSLVDEKIISLKNALGLLTDKIQGLEIPLENFNSEMRDLGGLVEDLPQKIEKTDKGTKKLAGTIDDTINLLPYLASGFSTAFDPDITAGERFKQFIISFLGLLEQVIVAAGLVNISLKAIFSGPLGIPIIVGALASLEGAKALVRSAKFGTGGEFIATRPQIIMVGESGDEHVKITPTSVAGQGGGMILNQNFFGMIDDAWIRNKFTPVFNRLLATGQIKLNI